MTKALGERHWWLLYPFYGVEMLDTTDGLRYPLFGQFSVVSRQHLPLIAKRLRGPFKFDDDKIVGDNFSTFLAVRTRITAADDDIYDSGGDEAKLFSAILALATLSTNFIWSCSLLENLSKRESEHRLAISSDGRTGFKFFGEREKLPIVCFSQNTFRFTRPTLRKLLLSRDLGFGLLLLSKAHQIPMTLSGPLKAAILILDDTLRQRNLSLQLVGCVTAMETLFKKDGASKYGEFAALIPILLGSRSTQHLKFKSILNARNDFVHSAKAISDESLVRSSLCLALACLVAYSNLVKNFHDRKSMIRELEKLMKPNASVSLKLRKRVDSTFEKFARIEHLRHYVVQDWKYV